MAGLWAKILSILGMEKPQKSVGIPPSGTLGAGANLSLGRTSAAEPSSCSGELAHLSFEECWWLQPQEHCAEELELELPDLEEVFIEIKSEIGQGKIELLELPEKVQKILRELAQESFAYARILSLVEQTPSLHGALMRTANSVMFCRGTVIKDLSVALPRLGRRTVRSIAYVEATSLSNPRNAHCKTIAAQILEHASATARIAYFLSDFCEVDESLAYEAGLLHEAGKLVLLKAIDKRYLLPKDLKEEQYTELMFGRQFQNLHSGAGGLLAEHWHLDEEIVAVISDNPAATNIALSMKLSSLIRFSARVARVLGQGPPLPKGEMLLDCSSAVELGFDQREKAEPLLAALPEILKESAE